jgi:hypothetical protein
MGPTEESKTATPESRKHSTGLPKNTQSLSEKNAKKSGPKQDLAHLKEDSGDKSERRIWLD